MKKEISNSDILEAIDIFATNVDERFKGIDEKFKGIDERFNGIDERFNGIDGRLDRIESQMVTKDYLDDKLADLRGDLVVLMRKEDTKLKTLVEILLQRKLLSPKDVKRIVSLEPFPEIALSS